jgi:hypothetical protein
MCIHRREMGNDVFKSFIEFAVDGEIKALEDAELDLDAYVSSFGE